MERREMAGESSKRTREVCKQEAAEQPPLDHKSDQGEPEYEEDLGEANRRADRLDGIHKKILGNDKSSI